MQAQILALGESVQQDSAIIKPVAFAPVRELLNLYAASSTLTSGADEPKQVFFSFDATNAYGTGAEQAAAENQIIHLNENTQALYGFTWNTEPEDELGEGGKAK